MTLRPNMKTGPTQPITSSSHSDPAGGGKRRRVSTSPVQGKRLRGHRQLQSDDESQDDTGGGAGPGPAPNAGVMDNDHQEATQVEAYVSTSLGSIVPETSGMFSMGDSA